MRERPVLDATADRTTSVVDRLRQVAVVPGLGGVESLGAQPITTTASAPSNAASPTA
ncbi:hypothetical protein ACFV98_12370 [Streptomyces violascens]|uniref:hypothetical protein n=1 Tax=Streptomyces violascens TaxID=67381 RepID=UPI0036493925